MYQIERDKPSLLCALLVVETKIPKISTCIPTPIAVMCSCIPLLVDDGRQTVQAITLHLSATAGREMLICIFNLNLTILCSPGSSKIKGTDYGIYPVFDDFYDLLPGQYMYCPGSSPLASWAIHVLPRKQVMKS